MLSKTNTDALVQLAAIVYSGSDDVIRYSKKNITRKIVQLSIAKNSNEFQTPTDISKYIKDTFGLIFFENEIWDIVIESKDTFVIEHKAESDSYKDNECSLISLAHKEYNKISTKSNTMSFGNLILDFYNSKCNSSISLESVTNLILDFLFKHFVINIKNYSNLVMKNSNRYSETFLSELKCILPNQYTEEEKDIINSFIDYEDVNKNKYIFYIITLALEYCITLNLPNGSIPNEILTKKIYLDSNILFRAIGLNGTDRQDKTLMFLNKCIETGQKLFITSITENEFEKSLKLQCYNLDMYKNTTQKSYNYLADENDITSTFLSLKRKNPNLNSEMFRANIQADYKKLKAEYKIIVDYIRDFEDNTLDNQINSLYKYKYSNDNNSNYKETCKTDIYNLNFISRKSTPENPYPNDIFITADQKLLYWIKTNNLYNNIALMPSDWLSFMLRFVSRSDNEYKSFVDLLKITPINEIHFEPYQIAIILNMVSDVEEDPDRQEVIIGNIIANQFDDIKSLSLIRDEQEFISNTDVIISREIKSLFQEDIEKLKQSSESQIVQKDIVIEKLQNDSEVKNRELLKLEDKVKNLEKHIKLNQEIQLKKKVFKTNLRKVVIKWAIVFFLSIIIYLKLKPLFLSSFKVEVSNSLGYNICSMGISLIGPILLSVLGQKIKILNIPTLKNTINSYKEYKKIKL